MATRLFIENKEVELDKSVQFAITKQFEDLSNPTAIINDWSKTVSIPFTQKNNNLFGHIYNPDRLIVAGNGSVGIFFDPTKKLNFRLQDGDNVLMTGYAKMNEIKQKDGKGTYEITLFGELGKIFQELKKNYNQNIEKNIFSAASNVNMNKIIGFKKDGVKHSFLEEYDEEE